MDVGAPNFRFDLDIKNGLKANPQTYRYPATTELRLDSLDRYLPSQLNNNTTFDNFLNQNVAKLAGPNYVATSINATNMTINNGRNLLYGYFGRVALTQFMMKRDLPTIRTNVNDILAIDIASSAAGPVTASVNITIPEGYYTTDRLATELQTLIVNSNAALAQAFVLAPYAVGNDGNSGFLFGTGDPLVFMAILIRPGLNELQTTNRLRCFRTLGINRFLLGYPIVSNTDTLETPTYYIEARGSAPNLLVTDYVDIVSTALTNYKDAKDANSSLASPGAVLGRVWLVESATNNSNDPDFLNNIGSRPITVIKTWTNPNWCQWSPNQSLTALDIRILDQFGNRVDWNGVNGTEWSATLTFTE
jgi:hypothetical protein